MPDDDCTRCRAVLMLAALFTLATYGFIGRLVWLLFWGA